MSGREISMISLTLNDHAVLVTGCALPRAPREDGHSHHAISPSSDRRVVKNKGCDRRSSRWQGMGRPPEGYV